jgi:hypothetical protein
VRRITLVFAFTAVLVACAFLTTRAEAKPKWKDVDKDLLAESRGIVDPEAPSETVIWEVRVTDSFDGKGIRSEEFNYVRVKIFNERGRDLESKFEIPYRRGESVGDIAGRTTRPNGTIVELKKDAVFDRTVVKAGGYKGKAKSFAMPGVEPGAVIEYQWKIIRRDIPALILYAQKTTPIRSMTITVTPFNTSGTDYSMQIRSFNVTHGPPAEDGITKTIRLEKIRGVETEPYMPPDDQVRPWFLLEYVETRQSTDEYWKKVGSMGYEAWKPYLGVTPAVRRFADSLVTGAFDFDGRIRAIHDFCRTKIRNVYDDAHDFTDDFRSKLLDDEKRMPEETLRRGYGTSDDINQLFAALAEGAGFRSRMAVVSDRSENFFRRDHRLGFQLSEHLVAVLVGGQWKFYDPAHRDIPAGMLPWWEESQEALVLDKETPVFATTPLSLPSRSLARRAGRLRLGADGTLEGEVREIYTGHLAMRKKEDLDELSPSRRREEVQEQLRARWTSATVDSITVSGVDEPLQPYEVAYRITLPDYAERVGKRLLVQPEVFERGASSVFTASTRTHWIYFRHPWSEEDSLTIELPSGYEIVADPAPGALQVGRTIAHRMAVEVDERTVRLHRYMGFGMDGTILIHPSEYGRLKKGFDSIQQRDGYTLTLRPLEAAER